MEMIDRFPRVKKNSTLPFLGKTLHDYNLARGLHFHCRFDDHDFLSRSRCVRNIYGKLWFVTHMENINLHNDQHNAGRSAGRPIVLAWQKRQWCNFFENYKCEKCPFLLDGSTYWALAAYSTFSDLGCIARSPHWQTVLSENVMLLPD